VVVNMQKCDDRAVGRNGWTRQSETTKDDANNIECAVFVERLLVSRVIFVVHVYVSSLAVLTSLTVRRQPPLSSSAITRLSLTRELAVILYTRCRLL